MGCLVRTTVVILACSLVAAGLKFNYRLSKGRDTKPHRVDQGNHPQINNQPLFSLFKLGSRCPLLAIVFLGTTPVVNPLIEATGAVNFMTSLDVTNF